jgi:hypothetical protein
MAQPHYLILYGACNGPTNSSQLERQDFWCFMQILHLSLLDICTFSTISTNNTINTINNNYSYVYISANNGAKIESIESL